MHIKFGGVVRHREVSSQDDQQGKSHKNKLQKSLNNLSLVNLAVNTDDESNKKARSTLDQNIKEAHTFELETCARRLCLCPNKVKQELPEEIQRIAKENAKEGRDSNLDTRFKTRAELIEYLLEVACGLRNRTKPGEEHAYYQIKEALTKFNKKVEAQKKTIEAQKKYGFKTDSTISAEEKLQFSENVQQLMHRILLDSKKIRKNILGNVQPPHLTRSVVKSILELQKREKVLLVAEDSKQTRLYLAALAKCGQNHAKDIVIICPNDDNEELTTLVRYTNVYRKLDKKRKNRLPKGDEKKFARKINQETSITVKPFDQILSEGLEQFDHVVATHNIGDSPVEDQKLLRAWMKRDRYDGAIVMPNLNDENLTQLIEDTIESSDSDNLGFLGENMADRLKEPVKEQQGLVEEIKEHLNLFTNERVAKQHKQDISDLEQIIDQAKEACKNCAWSRDLFDNSFSNLIGLPHKEYKNEAGSLIAKIATERSKYALK